VEFLDVSLDEAEKIRSAAGSIVAAKDHEVNPADETGDAATAESVESDEAVAADETEAESDAEVAEAAEETEAVEAAGAE